MVLASVRLLNATSTGGQLFFEAPEDDFRRFDRLPHELRWRLADNNGKTAAAAFEAHIDWAMRFGHGARKTVAKVDELERNELAVFAGEYRGLYGHELPHLAAAASIQRYGERGPSKHPPRRCGKPVFRRQHPKRRTRR